MSSALLVWSAETATAEDNSTLCEDDAVDEVAAGQIAHLSRSVAVMMLLLASQVSLSLFYFIPAAFAIARTEDCAIIELVIAVNVFG